ncbi:hypothetical protein PMI01_03148 [Caulobacter sp. AP07]|uniref:hypothetical protein n=1 Tax=Caulobacter sp. AP07 TaxID=1144304 RepID=UPI000271FCAB|nr:hypothetical protein [Caulobacter sp. AP07]EJL30371.1 hypothetical protein PMI01_03148 [Caulobacter sp. AP07]
MDVRLLLLGMIGVTACAAAPAAPTALARGGPVALGAAPVRLELPLSPALRDKAASGSRLRLALGQFTAAAQPGVLYRVSLEGDPGPALGYVNFYNVVTGGPTEFSFEATEPLARAAKAGRVVVVITPVGTPNPDAGAGIGRIEVFAH